MDLDKKLYSDYLNGNKEAFELLYNKYKSKIEYFIYNIVKDYDRAEDLTQETFIYIMQNKLKEEYSFKHLIYLVAKSKAINFISVENRRTEINKIYTNTSEQIEKDVLEIITKEETKKDLMEAIELLDERYKNAVYLANIEELSYKEISSILGESLQNTKNLIHRGKKQLKKLLIKKGYGEMKKVLIVIICIVLLSGVVYATTIMLKKYNTNHNISMRPAFQSTLDENTINNLWVGTLDLAWKELEEKIGKDKIELIENVEIANDLNESKFSKKMLDENDYEIKVERTPTNGYKIDTTLKKKLNFLEVFDNFSYDYNKWNFGDGENYIKYFGINNSTLEEVNKNIEILFYNNESNDFAVKLKTKEGDEIILYRTDDKKSFDEYYQDIKNKSNSYTGNREFAEDDEIRIPFVRVNGMISYDELYGKEIKDSNGLIIFDVTQNVNFSLNEKGCNLSSSASMVTEYLGIGNEPKYCYFNDTFIIFMKEANVDNPYFALKVDNDDILEKIEEIDEPKILDYTMMKNSDRYKAEEGECKFFEDENYEYYFSTKKTAFVQVYFKDGESSTVEWALKNGKISIDLLDKYGIEYIKKEKNK